MVVKKVFNLLMGQLRRGAQRFNAENRAFREIEKQQTRPTAAPKHPTNLKYNEQIDKGTMDNRLHIIQ